MTDQTESDGQEIWRALEAALAEPIESASEHPIELALLDSFPPKHNYAGLADACARAIRALEAKVRKLEKNEGRLRKTAGGWFDRAHERRLESDELRADLARLVGEVRSGELAVISLTKALGDEQDRAAELAGEVEELAKEFRDICHEMPGVAFMDPPDGGSPSLAVQVGRMREALQTQDAEVTRLTAELAALRAERSTMDCRFAGQYWEASGSHCPLDSPCVRCERDRLREEYDILECNLANDGVLSLSEQVARLTAELAKARENEGGR